ncbi:MAG: MotA/TolQ/ExbB proton channel family protein [Pikeienuella sp.]|uniref:MotA/TolQ/ExbB proton channel family protein n=1 Tax=Pikeienuella sp. TaxID=2831957 RepID=UPI00391BC82A
MEETLIQTDPALDAPLAAAPEPGLLAGIEAGMDTLLLGGPIVGVLVGMSVLALAIVIAKAWQFFASGVGEGRAAEAALALWRRGDAARALAAARGGRGPASAAMREALEGAMRGADPGGLREEVIRLAADRIEDLRAWLRPLEVIASLAPLLGLFGTVLGMIDAFAALEAAGSRVDPAILSGGIWEALLTTAVGLAVAIPAVAALAWLERRVERLERRIDSLVAGFFATGPGLAPAEKESGHERSFGAAPSRA